MFSIHFPLFRVLLSAVQYPLSAFSRLPFAVRYPLSAFSRFIVSLLLSAVHCSFFTFCCLLSFVRLLLFVQRSFPRGYFRPAFGIERFSYRSRIISKLVSQRLIKFACEKIRMVHHRMLHYLCTVLG